jgi:hypothetical protein
VSVDANYIGHCDNHCCQFEALNAMPPGGTGLGTCCHWEWREPESGFAMAPPLIISC